MGLAKEIAMAQTFGSGGSGGSGGVQPDYLQNDENAADYIKNRPFYTSDPIKTELVNGTFGFTDSGDGLYANINGINVDLIEGKMYSVVLDSVEYNNLMCFHVEAGNASVLVIGIKSAEEEWYTSCPFVYQNATMDGSKMTVFSTNVAGDSHDITIKGLVSSVVPIPDKYIPEMNSVTLISSTANSTKKFKITVDDSGALTATEVTG